MVSQCLNYGAKLLLKDCPPFPTPQFPNIFPWFLTLNPVQLTIPHSSMVLLISMKHSNHKLNNCQIWTDCLHSTCCPTSYLHLVSYSHLNSFKSSKSKNIIKDPLLLKLTNYSLHHHATPNDPLVQLWDHLPRKPKSVWCSLMTKAGSKPDPYYGHKNTVCLCAYFITHLFVCPKYPPHFFWLQFKATEFHHPWLNCTLWLCLWLLSSFNGSRIILSLFISFQELPHCSYHTYTQYLAFLL